MTRPSKQIISLNVNGDDYELAVRPNRTLLEVLREDLMLTGTKEGCEDGSCGTCTVLLDGAPVRSCMLLAVDVAGRHVVTIEGLASDNELHPVQKAFVEYGAIQCGYCSPGMILTAKALLDTNPNPTEEEIKLAISGNLCRCTGYNKIVSAIKIAGENIAGVSSHE
ncbi:MAG: (2Fe-2S)-binding protein [Syntrophorhabdaceae bacterium]|nr:(2Fe-2S)-binding protein [Syntrophorhabdaceae bacterium]MDD4194993.1 (2Fe-2S)-binding protein [Syntrophorhabdaceae bacterium]HOC47045.1 (2Fe-2S)-binding protein [Syntrophorhabdaceae bacterium]